MARARVAALPAGPVSEAAWDELRAALPTVPERSLRAALRASGRPLAPVAEGVRQDNFAELRRTLTALAAEYENAATVPRRRLLRALVITAKTHADLAARTAKTDSKRAEKREMALWIRSWLLNPGAFPLWAALRERQASGSSSTVTN